MYTVKNVLHVNAIFEDFQKQRLPSVKNTICVVYATQSLKVISGDGALPEPSRDAPMDILN